MFRSFVRVAPHTSISRSQPFPRSIRLLSRNFQPTSLSVDRRNLHTTVIRRDRSFTNLLADDNPPPVQVSSLSDKGILLADGLLIPGACIFLEGKVYLWDTPDLNTNSRKTQEIWRAWAEERFQIFDVVTPRPEILLLGTGRKLIQLPPFIQAYLGTLGIQLDVMDTRNACSTYNLLAEEGRRVAAALLPLTPHPWQKTTMIGNRTWTFPAIYWRVHYKLNEIALTALLCDEIFFARCTFLQYIYITLQRETRALLRHKTTTISESRFLLCMFNVIFDPES